MTKLQTVSQPHVTAIDRAADMYEARVNSLRESFTMLREESLELANMRDAVLFRNTSIEHVVRSIKNGTATIEAMLARVN